MTRLAERLAKEDAVYAVQGTLPMDRGTRQLSVRHLDTESKDDSSGRLLGP